MGGRQSTLIFVFLQLFLFVGAQSYNGHVFDQDGNPVAYANIGFLGTNIGTVSNAKGKFNLNPNSSVESHELVFSCIGYTDYTISWNDLIKMQSSDIRIQLNKTAYTLPEIEVRPVEWVNRKVGNFVRSTYVQAGSGEHRLGYEAGVRMKIKKKPAYIEKIAVHISQNEYDTIFYRLNVYNIKGRKIGDNLLPQPVYINLVKENLENGLVEIDLSMYNIRVDDDFLVTLEHVKDLGKGGIHFASKLFSRTYFRMTSQADWESIGLVGISIGCYITQEK